MLRICGLAIAGVVMTVFVTGCSNSPSDLPDLATVSGTVTMDGKPLANVNVEFESAGGQATYGATDANGHYELVYSGEAKGAAIGENTVRITTILDHPTSPGYKDPIPAKYNTASELKVTVKAGENTHDFPLEK